MSEELITVLLRSAAVIGLLMAGTWLFSLVLKNASIVDLIWGLGFVLVAWTSFLSAAAPSLLLTLLTSVWGLRLSLYLAWRNHGQPEDFRYAAMRRHHGQTFPIVSLLTVFALQGTIMWIVSLPLQAGIPGSGHSSRLWLTGIGIVLYSAGLFFEAVGDWQLARFRSDTENKGRVLDTGLWRYTRHPNYFGDFLVWWGLWIVAMSHGAGWWTISGPLVMSVLLMRVSGVTLLERSLRKNKPHYEDYIRRTSAFFPRRPSPAR